MSALHHKVQRTLVRAYFDPAFAAALCSPSADVAGVEPDVARFFRALDARYLDTDSARHSRVLQAMLEDYRVGATMIVAEIRSFESLHGFFSSGDFVSALERRASLAVAFGDYLLDMIRRRRLTAPHLADVVMIERARAMARHMAPRPEPVASDMLTLAPGVSLLTVAAGVDPVFTAVEAYLQRTAIFPQYALAEDAPRLSYPDIPADGHVAYLVVPGLAADEAAVIALADDAHAIAVVIAENDGLAMGQVLARAAQAGIAGDAADAIVEDLLACGALTGRADPAR